ncbi:MAG: NAD-dependent epimerase/dehydratase family protein, partial [Pseudolabrys sp.]|nr:NAD-dependent epimerase/dehydratase family protein [Pseudolabrys sp.]
MGHRVFITGAAGYIGGMLCELLSQRPDVERIIALDHAPMPDALVGCPNIVWIAASTGDTAWTAAVAAERPDIVIHAAWKIRDRYGAPDLQR